MKFRIVQRRQMFAIQQRQCLIFWDFIFDFWGRPMEFTTKSEAQHMIDDILKEMEREKEPWRPVK